MIHPPLSGRHFEMQPSDLSAACSSAAEAVSVLSHLKHGFAGEVAPRLNNAESSSSTRRVSSEALPVALNQCVPSREITDLHPSDGLHIRRRADLPKPWPRFLKSRLT